VVDRRLGKGAKAMNSELVVVGQGYVGLPLAVRAAEAGFEVLGFDTDETRVKRLSSGSSYVDDVSDERLTAVRDSRHFECTSSLEGLERFEVAVITVPTPLREGVPDLSYIQAAGEALASRLSRGATVVLESTTYPGTTEEFLGPILEAGSGLQAGRDFHLGFSPERIDPGNEEWTFESTPKVVSGIDEASQAAIADFYGKLVDRVVLAGSTGEAELSKLVENTFRHVNIALVNEIAMFAGELGIDVWAALDAAATKPFGYMPFRPGPGVGGHCLPIDPSYLSWRVRRNLGRSFRFVELANDINEHMPDYVVRRLTAGLNRRRKALNGSRILVLGLAYKRNTGDARESPALRIIDLLCQSSAQVRAADPFVDEAHVPAVVERVDLTEDEVRSADAVVVITDHDSFDFAMVAASAEYILDTRNRVPRSDRVEVL
jgi:UDP-N-acetyl-D-glucosamine dehydrogenase